MALRIDLLSGLGLATLGVGGLATGGILWNFQGRTLGIGTTVSSLVVIGISMVILRPQPVEPVLEPTAAVEGSKADGITLQLPQISILGALLATVGTLGLAASGIGWKFQGLALGLTGTLTSLVALLLSVLFLWPVGRKQKPSLATAAPAEVVPAAKESTLTTTEAIRRELAEAQTNAPEVTLVNFAPTHLVPGRTLISGPRKPGSSLGRYRRMAEDLFRS